MLVQNALAHLLTLRNCYACQKTFSHSESIGGSSTSFLLCTRVNILSPTTERKVSKNVVEFSTSQCLPWCKCLLFFRTGKTASVWNSERSKRNCEEVDTNSETPAENQSSGTGHTIQMLPLTCEVVQVAHWWLGRGWAERASARINPRAIGESGQIYLINSGGV
jgi:hypothetical protein